MIVVVAWLLSFAYLRPVDNDYCTAFMINEEEIMGTLGLSGLKVDVRVAWFRCQRQHRHFTPRSIPNARLTPLRHEW